MGRTVVRVASVSRPALLSIFWAGVLCLVFLLALGPDDVQLGRSPDDWARALGHPREAVRQAATEKLLAAGPPAAEALRRVAEQPGDTHRSERCVDVLHRLYQSHDPQVYQAADAALAGLRGCKIQWIRGYVSTTSNINAALRLSRCAIAFEECGGEMRVDPRHFQAASPDRPAEALTAVIGMNWRGGDEGLVHLRRMPHLRVVHVFEDARVSRQAVARLREDRPDVTVIYRNESCLGVAGVFCPTYFEVLTIEPNSGAARVGIRPHDRIVRFAGQDVVSFGMIAAILLDYSPGELIPIVIDRGGERMSVDLPVGRLQGRECACGE